MKNLAKIILVLLVAAIPFSAFAAKVIITQGKFLIGANATAGAGSITPTFVASSTAIIGGSGATLTINQTSSIGDFLVFCHAPAFNTSTFTPSATVNGTVAPLTIDSGSAPNNRARVFLWVFTATSTSNAIQFQNVNNDRSTFYTAAYTGGASVRATTTANKAVAQTGSPSVTITSATGELVVNCTSVGGAQVIGTVGAGQTQRASITNNAWGLGATEKPGATSVATTWSGSGDDWASVAVSLQGTAGTATPGNGLMIIR